MVMPFYLLFLSYKQGLNKKGECNIRNPAHNKHIANRDTASRLDWTGEFRT